jgi:hypothetical protein
MKDELVNIFAQSTSEHLHAYGNIRFEIYIHFSLEGSEMMRCISAPRKSIVSWYLQKYT